VCTVAFNLYAQVIGTAFGAVQNRKGTAKETGKPYDFNILKVLVPNGGISEVVLPDDAETLLFGGALPADGDPVDLTVEVSPRPKGFGTQIIRNNLFAASYAAA
jgi:hypothetical protein